METDEELETGAGAFTPSGDNLCNDYAQGLAEGFRTLAEARGDRIDADDTAALGDGGSASLFGNVAVIRRPVDESDWPALAARMRAFYGGRPGDDFEIRPVTDAATARDWEHALVHGYPEPALQPFAAGCFLPERALVAPRWRHWVGYLSGEAVGTASAFVGEHHVDVEFISTLGSVRGRGVGRALTVAATLAAPELPAMLISSDPGRSVYERLGYLPLLRFTLWAGHRSPRDHPIS